MIVGCLCLHVIYILTSGTCVLPSYLQYLYLQYLSPSNMMLFTS